MLISLWKRWCSKAVPPYRSGDDSYFLRLFPLVPYPSQLSQQWYTSKRPYWDTMKADALASTPCVAVSAGACRGHFRWFQRPKLGDDLYFLRLFPLVPYPSRLSQPWKTSGRPYWDEMKADGTIASRAISASDSSKSDGHIMLQL